MTQPTASGVSEEMTVAFCKSFFGESWTFAEVEQVKEALQAALAALKPFLGGATPQNESAFDEIKRLRREIGRRQMRLQFLVLGDPTKGVNGRAQTLLDEIAASPDKGGE